MRGEGRFGMRLLHVHSGNLYGGVEALLHTVASCRELCPERQSEFVLCFEGRIAAELRQAGEIGMVILQGCRCRCGHEWLQRIRGERPRTCPKCKSPNWDRPR